MPSKTRSRGLAPPPANASGASGSGSGSASASASAAVSDAGTDDNIEQARASAPGSANKRKRGAASTTENNNGIESGMKGKGKKARDASPDHNDDDEDMVDLEGDAEMEMDEDDEQQPAGLAALAGQELQSTQWLETLEKCVRSIVSIRFSQVAAFDTDAAGNSEVRFVQIEPCLDKMEAGVVLGSLVVALRSRMGVSLYRDDLDLPGIPWLNARLFQIFLDWTRQLDSSFCFAGN